MLPRRVSRGPVTARATTAPRRPRAAGREGPAIRPRSARAVALAPLLAGYLYTISPKLAYYTAACIYMASGCIAGVVCEVA